MTKAEGDGRCPEWQGLRPRSNWTCPQRGGCVRWQSTMSLRCTTHVHMPSGLGACFIAVAVCAASTALPVLAQTGSVRLAMRRAPTASPPSATPTNSRSWAARMAERSSTPSSCAAARSCSLPGAGRADSASTPSREAAQSLPPGDAGPVSPNGIRVRASRRSWTGSAPQRRTRHRRSTPRHPGNRQTTGGVPAGTRMICRRAARGKSAPCPGAMFVGLSTRWNLARRSGVVEEAASRSGVQLPGGWGSRPGRSALRYWTE